MIIMSRNKWQLLPIAVLALMGLSFLISPHKAKAINNIIIQNQAPVFESANTDPANQAYTPWLAVGVGEYNGPFSYAKVYTKQDSNLTITQSYCSTDVGTPTVTYYVYRMQTSGNKEIYASTVGSPISKGPGTCGPNNPFTIPLTGGIPSTLPGHTGWSTFYVQAFLSQGGPGDNERSFRLSVDNGGLVGLSRPEFCGNNFNPCNSGDIDGFFGIYSRNLGPQTALPYQSDMWDYAVQFAPRCNETVGPGTSVTLYDMDPGVYSPQNLGASIQQDNRSNSTFNWNTILTMTNSQFQPGSAKYDTLTYTSSQVYRNRLVLSGINWRNTIQVYLPNDEFDAQPGVGQACNPKPIATCTAKAVNPAPSLGTQTNINVTVTNASGPGGPTFPTSYQIRITKISDGTGGGGARYLSTSLAPNQTDTGIQPFTPVARSTAGAVTFYFDVFDGDTAGATAIGQNHPECQTTINWGCTVNCVQQPGGNFTVDCKNVTISGLTSNATSSGTTAASPEYWTAAAPAGQIGGVNYWTGSWPVAFTPSGNPPPPAQPAQSFFDNTYHLVLYRVGLLQTSGAATFIPIHIQFFDSNNNLVSEVYDKVPYPPGSKTYDTFNAFTQLWPHEAYRATLDAQTTGSLGAGGNGPYTYDQHFESTGLAGQCLQGNACLGQGNGVDIEPGQIKQYTYNIQFDNQTNKAFGTTGGGYGFRVDTSPGVYYQDNQSSTDIQPGNTIPTTVSFNLEVRFQGTYNVVFLFQGSQLGIINFDGVCPSESPIPSTKPYFEVRGADLSTGGGFRDIDETCPGTGSNYYVSPSTGWTSSSGPYDYAGGVRAYSIQNPPGGPRGSLTQYGDLSLGYTIGSPNGPIGFYSVHGQMFANTGVPNAPNGGNLGGYLNPTAVSSAHCQEDFFTNQRINPSPPSLPSNSLATGISSCPVDSDTGSNRCEYQAPGGITISATTIPVNYQITIYVDGDVTIDGNILYDKTWDATKQYSIPYLAIIARGSITVTHNATELDGLYVAQPSNDFNGKFSTCGSNDFCPLQLVVNGAVIAQKLELNRVHGTLSKDLNSDANGLCAPFAPSNCPPAEIFNYSPSMLMGRPDFSPLYTSIEALFNLPPVF